MALITKPDMEFIWASGGAIVEPSDAKKQTGWTPEVPPHQWENWIQNRQDNYLAHINQRGIPEWDGNTEYEAGGLSYVQGSNGVVYKSVAASGPATTVQDPTTDVADTYWTVAFAELDTTRIDVASASNVNLTTSAPNTRHINITGTTAITGFTVAAGRCYFVRFAGALTLTGSASLVTNTGANITTAAGDTCIVRATAANVVEVLAYTTGIPQALGYRQTLQDVFASRAINTTYTNSTGRLIYVMASINTPSGTQPVLIIDGENVGAFSNNGTGANISYLGFVVPNGSTYRISGGTSASFWTELR